MGLRSSSSSSSNNNNKGSTNNKGKDKPVISRGVVRSRLCISGR
jgi:hypothetical protein